MARLHNQLEPMMEMLAEILALPSGPDRLASRSVCARLEAARERLMDAEVTSHARTAVACLADDIMARCPAVRDVPWQNIVPVRERARRLAEAIEVVCERGSHDDRRLVACCVQLGYSRGIRGTTAPSRVAMLEKLRSDGGCRVAPSAGRDHLRWPRFPRSRTLVRLALLITLAIMLSPFAVERHVRARVERAVNEYDAAWEQWIGVDPKSPHEAAP